MLFDHRIASDRGADFLALAPDGREVSVHVTLDEVFADAATRCRFRDCAHDREPGCAVRAEIEPGRRERWRALRAELAYLDRRDDPAALAEEKRRGKSITRSQRSNRA